MDPNTIKDILTYFTLAVTLINLYKMLVGGRQETQDTNLKETDKAFAEFVKTYAGQYSETKTKLEYVEKEIKELFIEQDKLIMKMIDLEIKLKIHTTRSGEGGE